jgi:hypothetical protein
MTWITAADPLALIAIQSGQINAPSGSAAASTTQLDAQQRFIALGEPVPIVFARFRNSKGGILVSPGATEAQYVNNINNDVTARYHLPISEGQISSIARKDVFQRACRVGSHTQTYDRRAGTWPPGNFLVQRAGKNLPTAPYFCGSVGLYSGISTLSFSVTIPDGFDQYNRQVHLFIRGGMYVTRIYDSIFGPSDNFADLVKWLMVNTSRVPAAMIDDTALLAAATFLEYNSFACNCELRTSTNLTSLLASWAPYFLLGESSDGGKKGLRPLLPTTAAGAINTGTIVPEFTFTEDLILPGTLEINYLSLADRLPFVAQVIWRQQLESNIGIIRTAEVRYAGTATAGPYETHDLSAFCTNENHAVKVGAYMLAKRTYPTHIIRFTARPQAHNKLITVGDIISVDLQRQATNYVASSHHYLYQVERVTKTLAGDVTYEATHFPVDSQNRSLIALDVAAATGTGIIIPNIRTGVTCDSNSSADNTIPAEEYIEPGDANDPTDGTGTSTSTGGWSVVITRGGNNNGGPREDEPDDAPDNPDDDKDNDPPPISGLDPNNNGLAGLPLTVNTPCSVEWLRDGSLISGATSSTYTPTGDDIGKTLTPQVTCPGGAPQLLQPIPIYQVMPDFNENITATVTVKFDAISYGYDCTTGVPTFINDPTPATKIYTNRTFRKVGVHTMDGATKLAPTILYEVPCNDQVSRRRNAATVFETAAGAETIDSWASTSGNIASNDRKQLFHTSYITSIVQNGQEVLDLGLLNAVSNGASYWTTGGVVGA